MTALALTVAILVVAGLWTWIAERTLTPQERADRAESETIRRATEQRARALRAADTKPERHWR